MCKQIQRGDEIVEVDGKAADADNLRKLLIGSDIPGSLMTLKIKRGGQHKKVTLKRASIKQLADQRRIFQLFTESKDIALKHNTPNGKVMDQIIELWNNMTEAAYDHEEEMVRAVENMQADADSAVRMLRSRLEKLHTIILMAEQGEHEIAENQVDLLSQLAREKLAAGMLRKKLMTAQQEAAEATARHAPCEEAIRALEQELVERERQLKKLQRQLEEAENAAAEMRGKQGDLEGDLSRALQDVAARDARITALQDELAARDATIEALRRKIEQLSGELAADERKLEHDRQLISKLEGEVNADEAMLADDKVELARKSAQLEQLRQQLADAEDLAQSLREMHAPCAGVREALEQRLADREEQLAAAAASKAALEAELIDLKERHAPCDALVADLRKQMAALEEGIQARDRDLADLGWRLHQSEADLAALQQRLAERDERIAALEAQLAAALTQLAEKEAELGEAKRQGESRGDELGMLKRRLAALQMQHAPCNKMIAALRQQIEDTLHAVQQDDVLFAKTRTHAKQLHQDLQERRVKLGSSARNRSPGKPLPLPLPGAEGDGDGARGEAGAGVREVEVEEGADSREAGVAKSSEDVTSKLASKRFRAAAVAANVAMLLARPPPSQEAAADTYTTTGDDKSLGALKLGSRTSSKGSSSSKGSFVANAAFGASFMGGLFASADHDADGELDFGEFAEMTCNHGLDHDDLVDIFQVFCLDVNVHRDKQTMSMRSHRDISM